MTVHALILISFFFSIWVLLHEHSRFIGQKGGGGYLFNSSLPLPPISQALKTLAGRLLPRVHLCSELTPGLEPGALGFRAQVANH